MEFDPDSMRSGCTAVAHGSGWELDGDNGEFGTGPRSALSALLVARYLGRRPGCLPALGVPGSVLQFFLA